MDGVGAVDIEVVGGPEDSDFTKAELGVLAPKEEAATTPATTENKATEEKPVPQNTPWHWTDDLPGNGEKPAYMQDKFKTVAEQAKAYSELEKRLGVWKGAPKDGYNLDKLPEGMDKESPLLQGLDPIFKEMGLNQEGFEKLTNKFAQLHADMAVKNQEEITREAGGSEVVNRVANWITSLPADIQETVKSWSLSGADVKALDAIRGSATKSGAPTTNQADSRHYYETAKAVEAEKNKNWQQYTTDEAYRNEITRRWSAALEREKILNNG